MDLKAVKDNLALLHASAKGADQPAHPRSLISTVFFRLLQSATSKHASYNIYIIRRMAENGFAPPPPLENFADISYLIEN